MLGFLEEAFTWLGGALEKIVESLAGIVVFGAYTVVNGVFAAFQLLLDAANAVLPSLPEVTGPPEYVQAINWFFPLVTVLGIATTLLSAYVAFLAVKWIYKKFGAL
jgi:hypothetical protein